VSLLGNNLFISLFYLKKLQGFLAKKEKMFLIRNEYKEIGEKESKAELMPQI
jgi:hypothetical protein